MESQLRLASRTACPVLFLCLVALCIAAGCTGQSSPGAAAGNGAAEGARLTAEQIADRMLAAYRNARSYTDRATYVQHSVHRAEGVERELPFFDMSLAFERPNRLRLGFQEAVEQSSANQGFTIASDGKIVRAMAGGLPGQVQETAAPAELTLENFLPDPYLREVFQGRTIGDVFPQLAMLLHQDDRQQVFPSDEAPRLLAPQQLDGRRCYRVATTSPAGTRTLWIDCKNYLLRRMELPIDAQRRQLDPDGSYTRLAVWIDFKDASFNAAIDDAAFTMEAPADVRRVRRFVLPAPAAPPEKLGKSIAEVAFTTLDGQELTAKSFAGKTVLLDFWQINCAPCKAHTPALDALYRELAGTENFAFYAVNTEPTGRAPNDAVARTLASWGGTMPILRIASAEVLEKLQVAGTPTLLLLDADGRLQYRHERQVQDADALGQVIRRVLAGDDLAALARAERRQLLQEYERELEAATIRESIIEAPLAETAIAGRQEPKSLGVAELWRTDRQTIANPGYLLAVAGEGEEAAAAGPRILVVDGDQAIVELDGAGARKARRQIPAETATTDSTGAEGGTTRSVFLRTAVDGQENRLFAAAAAGGRKVHLFDEQLNHQLAFPPDRHPGIADVQLACLAPEAGPRLYVGYWGGVGVQGVGLDGRRQWSDRSLEHVVQVAVAPASPNPKNAASAAMGAESNADERELWCTSTRGTIHVLDAAGRPQRDFRVGLRMLLYVAAVDLDGDGQIEGCGLDVKSLGRYGVVGFTPAGDVAWEFELAPGEYISAVDRIQAVALPGGQAAWMVAAPDGTIYWLDPAGREIDRFAYGEPLSGLALTNEGEAAILWVSAQDHVAAYRLTGK
ncbi:MAG: hypothetical protein DCC67_00290 [Planctomycetota bacterium]|nr:MAG: hypothetical protein DCC67_00290 [Planctomycetota bacterium]